MTMELARRLDHRDWGVLPILLVAAVVAEALLTLRIMSSLHRRHHSNGLLHHLRLHLLLRLMLPMNV